MRVSDIMSKDVIYFYEDESIFDAISVLIKKNISGAPVLNREEKLVGIISLTDLVKFLNLELELNPKNLNSLVNLVIYSLKKIREREKIKTLKELLREIKVKDVMSKDVISISPHATILEAIKLMEEHDVSRLPVIEDDKLIGIVTKTDIVRFLLEI